MTNPFVTGLAVLHAGPCADMAIFTPAGGASLAPIMVVRGQPSEQVGYGAGQILVDTNLVQIRRSDVLSPRSGDGLIIGVESFKLQGDPKLDVEGLTWTCPLEPA